MKQQLSSANRRVFDGNAAIVESHHLLIYITIFRSEEYNL